MKKRITDKSLAKAANISPQTIVNWKKNKIRKNLYNLLKTGFICEEKRKNIGAVVDHAEELKSLLESIQKYVPDRYFDILYALSSNIYENAREIQAEIQALSSKSDVEAEIDTPPCLRNGISGD